MAAILKLRRGTTFTSLQESELFYDTSLETILLGDGGGSNTTYKTLVKLRESNSGSLYILGDITGSHISASGDISASNLELQGDANIGGNIILAGNIFLGDGDNVTDNININASFSGSIIPETDDVFSLGTAVKRYQNAFLVSASIEHLQVPDSGILSSSVTNFTSYSSSVDLRLDNSEDTGSNHRNRIVKLELTGSDHESRLDTIEGPFSTSVDLRLDNSELSGSNHRDRIVELEVTGSDHESRLDTIEGPFSTSLDSRLDYLEGPFSTSVDLRLDNSELSGSNHRGRIVQLEDFSASLDDAYEEKSSATHILVSGSSQVNADTVTNFDANVKDKLNSESVVSGSTGEQLTASLDLRYLEINGDGVFSGSSQVNADETTGWADDIKTQLNSNTVISGSSQVILNDANLTGFDTTDVVEGTNLYYTDARVKTKLNTETVISGSTQIDINHLDTDDLSEGSTNLYYTDARVKTKLNTETVVSGSSQVPMGGDISGNANDATVIKVQGVALTSDEATQISNIGSETISSTQWGYLGASNQGISTTDNVTFNTGSFTGDVSVTGNLTVLGSATEILTSELRITDKLITVASGSIDSAAADGAGIEIDGADVSLQWDHNTTSFVFDAKVSSSVGFKGEGGELTGIDTDQVTEATNLYYTDVRVKTKLNAETVLSGSGQVNLGHLTTDDLTEGTTNLYYTDVRVKTKLNAETVISGSSQLHTDLDNRYLEINGDGVVSGSSQILHDSTNGFVANEHIDHSSITIGSGKGLIGGGTIDTNRSLSLDTGSAHFDEGIKKIIDADGVLSGSSQLHTDLDNRYLEINGDNVFSGSSQVNADSITNFDSNVKDKLNAEVVHSGSYLGTSTTSNLSEGTNLYYTDVRVKTKLNSESVISGSSQLHTDLDNRYLEINGDGVISGSSQVNADSITNFDSNVKTKLDAEAVVSGSSFVSNHQGSITASINSVSTNVDLGLNIDDSPTFSSLTLSNTTTGTSSDLDALFDVSGVTKKRTLGTSAFFNVSSSIDDDPNSVPTTKAVNDALIAAGAGDITSVNSSNLYPASSTGIAHTGDGTQDGSNYYGNVGNVVIAIDTGSSHFQEGVELYLDGTYSDTDNTNHLNSLGVISGSAQLENTFLEINGDGVISGSSQITITESQISDLSHYTDANVKTKLDAEGVISGSSQITKTLQDVTDDGASTSTAIHITNTTTSAAKNTGALIVDGGLGVGGSITANLVQVYSATPKMMVTNNDSTIVDGQTVGSYQFRHTDADGGGNGGIFSIDLVATADFEGLNSTPAEYQFDTAIRVDGLVTASAFYGDGSNLTGVTSYTDSDNTDHLNSLGVVSGSGQIQTLFVGTAVSTSLDDRLDTLEGESHENPLTFTDTGTIDFTRSTDTITANIIGGVVSGSSQVEMGGDISGNANDATVIKVQGVALTSGEATQLANIGSETISSTQWGYLGASDQGISTTSDVTFASASLNNVVISGNLTVLGDAVQLGVSELTIEDKTITVASGSTNSTQADGAGILIAGADESITWNHANTRFNISDDIHVTGTIKATNDIIAFSSSDRELKNNIKPIPWALDKINKIGGYSFDWNEDKQDIYKGTDIGVIAQEIEEVLPELVQTRENGYKAVKYDKLVSLLIEGIKDLSKEVDELRKKIDNQ